mmetsp:Transcript_39664/g.126756  ORF Transcript_39664/g.126756 Transcript_39664/m.126756 type:complete len:204 (-) Transcript_39664:2290-2901(-)
MPPPRSWAGCQSRGWGRGAAPRGSGRRTGAAGPPAPRGGPAAPRPRPSRRSRARPGTAWTRSANPRPSLRERTALARRQRRTLAWPAAAATLPWRRARPPPPRSATTPPYPGMAWWTRRRTSLGTVSGGAPGCPSISRAAPSPCFSPATMAWSSRRRRWSRLRRASGRGTTPPGSTAGSRRSWQRGPASAAWPSSARCGSTSS